MARILRGGCAAIGVLVAAVSALGVDVAASIQATRRDADALREKVARIAAAGEKSSAQPRLTTLTEQEVNAYLLFDSGAALPPGIVEPEVAIVGPGRFSARALVDLDAVRRQKSPTSFLDPTYYLTGRLPVIATATLRTTSGVGRLDVESAAVGGVRVPKAFLQEIVTYYSRTPENPQGIGLDDPFALPANIREIQVEPGQAVIVQ